MCKHVFTKWTYVEYSKDHYDHEEWYQRVCIKCGKIEQMDVEDLIEKEK